MDEIVPEVVPGVIPPPVRGRGRARGPGRGRVVRGRAAGRGRGRANRAAPPGFEAYVDEERDYPPTPPHVPQQFDAPPPPPPPPPPEPRVILPQAVYEEMRRRADAYVEPVHVHIPPPAPVPPERLRLGLSEKAIYLKEFRKYDPPKFDGSSTDPEIADTWITSIERIHAYIDCPDSLKVHCGTFALVGDALYWWNSIAISLHPDLQISWDQFREKFLEKYYPIETRMKMEAMFLALKQGDMDVVDLERLFDRLSRHAPKFVSTPADRLDRFMAVLRDDLRGRVRAIGPQSYSHALSLAIDLDIKCPESTVKPVGAGFPSSHKRKAEDGHHSRGTQQWPRQPQWTGGGQQSRQNFRGQQSQFRQQSQQQRQPTQGAQQGYQRSPAPFCESCSRYHFGVCHAYRPCFACGQPGHLAQFCTSSKGQPQRHMQPAVRGQSGQRQGQAQSQTQGQGSRAAAPQQGAQKQGRVAAVTRSDADASTSVITGNFGGARGD